MVQLETLVLLNPLLLQEHPDLQEVQVQQVQLVLQDKVNPPLLQELAVLLVLQVQRVQPEEVVAQELVDLQEQVVLLEQMEQVL